MTSKEVLRGYLDTFHKKFQAYTRYLGYCNEEQKIVLGTITLDLKFTTVILGFFNFMKKWPI